MWDVRIRNRRGQGMIGLLMVVLTVAYLWKSGSLGLIKPASKADLPPQQAQLPELAVANTFKMTAQQVRNSVDDFKQKHYREPKDLAELHRETGLDLKLDPWGGRYYLQKGWLKCTGNATLAEQIW